jgi:hypothetical protein
MLARVGNTTAATARLREALPDAIVTLSPSTNADDPDGEYAFGAYAYLQALWPRAHRQLRLRRTPLPLHHRQHDQSAEVVGRGNGVIDPGEPVRLALTLSNLYRHNSRNAPDASATLTTSTPGVTIVNGTATFGAIPVQGSTPGTPLLIRLDQAAVCGSAIDFTLTVASSLGTSARDFLIRVGTPSGTGAPITYSKTTSLPAPAKVAGVL